VPTITDNAVCIRRWDFSETSQTVSLFTREHGIIRGLAKGAKREKGPFSGGLDVLTRGQVVAIIKPGRDLATITAWHMQDMFRAVRASLAANRAALYMADLVHHMLVEHDPHPRMYDALVAELDALSDEQAIDHALLRFQWMLLIETGYQPELLRDARTGGALPDDAPALAFSPAAGGLVADSTPIAGPSWRVRRETIDLLRRLNGAEAVPPADAQTIPRANRLLAVYFRELIGSEPPAMRWAFADLNI
jgi:DNA repair protein RecO (recombination protein O)